jgi:Holliday junction DNA helicase RuvA
MVSYIIGKIIAINKKSITLENNYVGYNIIVPNLDVYEVGKIKKIYMYKSLSLNNNKNKITEEMYGFDVYESKEMFLKLLQVPGIGYRTAILICSNDIVLLKQLIACKDEESLLLLKGINAKNARNILDTITLEQKDIPVNNTTADLVKALKTLGYSHVDIEMALNNIDKSKEELSELISDAIKCIAASCHLI